MSRKLWQLDALRGAAATYVVIYHAHFFMNTRLAPLFCLGPESVILFFLLSGFVISYSSDQRLLQPGGLKSYLMHRFRRIYPLFAAALLLTYVAGSIRIGHWAAVEVPTLLGNFCMLQDIQWMKRGCWFSTYEGNEALWSLSYEWWFYLFFAVVVLNVPNKRHRMVALAASLLAALTYPFAPTQIGLFVGYFYLWWSGVELARQLRREGCITWRGQAGNLVGLILLALAWSLPVVSEVRAGHHLRIGFEPFIEFRHAAAAVVFLVLGITWYRLKFVGFAKTLGWFVYVAPISYALYIFHVPLVQLASTLSPAAAAAIYLLVLIPLCYVGEVVVQPQINLLFDRLVRRPAKYALPDAAVITAT